MASPIVLSSDESEDEVVVVCETKAAPKDAEDDGDVVFLSIEKPDVGATGTGLLKTNPSDVTSVSTDSLHATPLASDNSDVTPLSTDSSDVTPLGTDSSDVSSLTGNNSDATPLNTDSLCLTPVDTNSLSGSVVSSAISVTNTQDVSDKQGKVEVFGDSCVSSGQRASSWAVVGSQTTEDVSTVLNLATNRTTSSISASVSPSVVSLATFPAVPTANSAIGTTDQTFRNWLLPPTDSGSALPRADSATDLSKTQAVTSSLTRCFSATYPSANSASHSALLSPSVSGESSCYSSPATMPFISDQRNVPLRKRLRSDGELDKVWCKLPAPRGTVRVDWRTRCTVCGEEERKVSRCMQGHQTCCICLEERAKYILSDKKGTTLKCLSVGCDSFYPMSELKHTLPGMVVDVLEIQLEKHYVDYLADMVMKEIDTSTGEDSVDQTGLKDSKTSADVKIQNEYMEVPASWVDMEPQTPFLLVQLEPETEDYVSVSLKFHETMKFGSVDIEKIFRVQNPILWKFYTVKKQQMSQDHGGEAVEEKLLFHGTNDEAVDAICKSGFDWRLCGKHGTMYGQGSYFAQTASYSHQYSAASKANRSRRIRACKIRISRLLKKSPVTSPRVLQPNNYAFLSSSAAVNPTNSGMSSRPGQGGLTMSPAAGGQFPASCVLPPSSPISQSSASHSSSRISHGSSPAIHGSSVFTASAGTVDPQSLGWQPSQPNPLNLSMSSYSTSSSSAPPNVTLPSPLGAHSISTPSSVPNSTTLTVPGLTGLNLPPALLAGVVSSQVANMPVGHLPTYTFGMSGNKQVPTSAHSTDSEPPVFKMFLARVLVGTYTTGSNELRKPPPLDPISDPYGMCFDSCVDNVICPKIFVVFDSAQAYPEYIVHYKENVS